MGDVTTGSDWTEYKMTFDALVGSTTLVLDIGAHIGTFTLFAAKAVGNEGTV